MKTNAKTVDEYIRSLEGERRSAMETLRSLVFEAAPQAKESMGYGMPTYEYKGKICAFASQKNYMNFYVMNIPILDRYRDQLRHLNVGKSCIRFTKIEKLPLNVLRNILKESVQDK